MNRAVMRLLRKCRERGAYLVFGFLVFVCVLEAASFAGLLVIRELTNHEYTPILPLSVSEGHKVTLKRILDGDSTSYLAFDSSLVWTIGPNRKTRDGLERSNSQGIRADRAYQDRPPQDQIRVMAFGDSFVHCDGVDNAETWQEYLSRFSSQYEVVNFGVPGYGPDQAYLRYELSGGAFHPDIVLIGFMSENINRVVSVFRPFYSASTGVPFAKPRFAVENGALVQIRSPLSGPADLMRVYQGDPGIFQALAEHDYWFRAMPHEGVEDWLHSVRLIKLFRSVFSRSVGEDGLYNIDRTYKRDSEALIVTRKLFDKFYRSVLEDGAVPIIVLFPTRTDLLQWKEDGVKRYDPLIEYLVAQEYRFIDLFEAFDVSSEEEVASYFIAHYSPKGNEAVAKAMLRYLESHNLTDRETLQKTVREELGRLSKDGERSEGAAAVSVPKSL